MKRYLARKQREADAASWATRAEQDAAALRYQNVPVVLPGNRRGALQVPERLTMEDIEALEAQLSALFAWLRVQRKCWNP